MGFITKSGRLANTLVAKRNTSMTKYLTNDLDLLSYNPLFVEVYPWTLSLSLPPLSSPPTPPWIWDAWVKIWWCVFIGHWSS